MRLFHREMECYLVAEGSFADIEEVGVVENGKAQLVHALANIDRDMYVHNLWIHYMQPKESEWVHSEVSNCHNSLCLQFGALSFTQST